MISIDACGRQVDGPRDVGDGQKPYLTVAVAADSAEQAERKWEATAARFFDRTGVVWRTRPVAVKDGAGRWSVFARFTTALTPRACAFSGHDAHGCMVRMA